MEKKILMLGSNYGSVDLVLQAKKMGLYVIAADWLETDASPIKQVADESWLISTADIDALEIKCRERNVDAVIAGALDFNLGNARQLCKRLKLPMYCENDETWEIANNKRKFKDLCKRVGAPVAKDYFLSPELTEKEINAVKFPVVVKPVDQCGNYGMSYCSNADELRKAYSYAKSVSSNQTIVVERELHGPEFAVNYVIAGDSIQLLYFSSEHSEPGTSKNMYALIDTTSYHLKQYLAEVNDLVMEVFRQAGCRDGIAWVECILDEDGKFYLLEMGHRFGGEMTYVPYEKISGFNALEYMIQCALGVKHDQFDLPASPTYPQREVAASYHIYAKENATIDSLDGLEEIRNMPDVVVDFVRGVGGKTVTGRTIGIIRIYAADCESLCNTIDEINRRLTVKDKEGRNLIVYFTDFSSLKEEYANGIKEWDEIGG